MLIKNKRVLITGAGRRVGAVLARAFAYAGAQVILHANKSAILAHELKNELGQNHEVILGNLENENEINALFQLLTNKKPIDILINNAASYACFDYKKETLSCAKSQFELNFWAPFLLMQLFGNQNIEEGCILNILDHQIEKISADGTSYALSKKALQHLSETAAISLAPKIRVNSLALGPVIPPTRNPNASFEKAKKISPLKKVATLNDVTDGALFLIKNDSITGQTLYIDCGAHLI